MVFCAVQYPRTAGKLENLNLRRHHRKRGHPNLDVAEPYRNAQTSKGYTNLKTTAVDAAFFQRADFFLDGAKKLSVDDVKKVLDGTESHRLTVEIMGDSVEVYMMSDVVVGFVLLVGRFVLLSPTRPWTDCVVLSSTSSTQTSFFENVAM